jgi:hypothetical protein
MLRMKVKQQSLLVLKSNEEGTVSPYKKIGTLCTMLQMRQSSKNATESTASLMSRAIAFL